MCAPAYTISHTIRVEESGVCFPFSLERFRGDIGPLGWVKSVCAHQPTHTHKKRANDGSDLDAHTKLSTHNQILSNADEW